MSVAKVPQQTSGRRRYLPGRPGFDKILIELSASGSTIQAVEQWVSAAASGDGTPRQRQVDLLNLSTSTVVGSVLLDKLVPVAFLPYATGAAGARTLVLDVGRFRLQ